MKKVLYTLNASCWHPTQYFAVSQSKVPPFDLMSSITSGITTSPQNRFLYSCGEKERERKKGKRRNIERKGEIRERERGERDREVKGAQSKPNPSPNSFPKLCDWFSGRFQLKGRGTRRVPSLRGKSSLNFPNRKIKRKERLITQITTR